MNSLSKKIKDKRVLLGLTAEDVAKRLNISRSYLTLIENGFRKCPKSLINTTATVLKLSRKDLQTMFIAEKLKELKF